MDTTAGSPSSLDLPVGKPGAEHPGTRPNRADVRDRRGHHRASGTESRCSRADAAGGPHIGSADFWLVGGSLNVKPADTAGGDRRHEQANPTTSEQWDFRRIIKVTADVKAGSKDPVTGAPTGVTHLVLDRALGPELALYRGRAAAGGAVSPAGLAVRLQCATVGRAAVAADPDPAPVGIYAGDKNKWAEQYLPSTANSIDLDTVYSQAVPGGWVVLTEAGSSASSHTAELFRINGAAETNLAEFALTGRATRLFISGMNIDWFSPRRASVFLQSEAQTLAERPINGPLERTRLTLASYVDGLQSGRTLIVAGQLARFAAAVPGLVLTAPDSSTRTPKLGDQFFLLGHAAGVYTLQAIDGWTGTIGTTAASFTQVPTLAADPVLAETVTIGSVDQSDLRHTAIVPVKPLVNFYDRGTVTIYGNVAQATVGQTVQEVMGSGNAATSFQSFQLRQPPVTWTLAATPSGVQSSLQVFANDVPWTEADTLYGQGAHAQVFAERRDELGNTNVLFGDGAVWRTPAIRHDESAGAVSPRAGRRRQCRCRADQSAVEQTAGVEGGDQPVAGNGRCRSRAAGGRPRERPAQCRHVGPRSVAVGLPELRAELRRHCQGARHLGLGWHAAAPGADAGRPGGRGGAAGRRCGRQARRVARQLRRGRGAAAAAIVYSPVTFQIGLLVRPAVFGNDAAAQQAAEAALRAAYTFDARGFGQAVALSEVVEIAQGAAGVAAVQVTMLYRSDQPAGLSPRLGAAGGTTGAQSAVPAEVLTLDPGKLAVLGAMA